MAKEYFKYVKQWQDVSIKINEAMQKDDFELADKLMKESVDLYEKYKTSSALPRKNSKKTFGELSYIFENELPNLLANNKKAVNECMNYIKNDKNLLSQFKFINSLNNYSCNGSAVDYINESLNMALENIDRKTLKKSVKGFSQILAKNEVGNDNINEEDKKFFVNCAKLISEKKSMSNLSDYTNTINEVAEYVEKHKKTINENKKNDINALTEALSNKMSQLSEESQSLVKDIIDFKSPMVEERQSKLLEKLKNECLNKIQTLKEGKEDTSDFDVIEEKIKSKNYCKETIIKDIANLLEIRDILFDD